MASGPLIRRTPSAPPAGVQGATIVDIMIEYLLSAQPFSDGGIIELKAQVGKQDIANEKSDSHWPYFAKGGVGLLSPQICVEEVHGGVVDDIERIGNIAQPATDGHL